MFSTMMIGISSKFINKAEQIVDESGMYLNVGNDRLYYIINNNGNGVVKNVKLKK